MADPKPIQVLNKRVQLLQAEGGLRTSLDSVMLAAACPVKSGERILDLGCGVGSAGLSVLARVPGAQLTGVEIQEDHVALARQNAALNMVADLCVFFHDDIRNFRAEPFDHVICNPPYMEAGTHTVSPSEKKARALGHADQDTDLKDWMDAALHNVKHGGSFTIIHRADYTDKIIQGFGKRFGAIEIIPLWPRAGEDAKRVIIRAIRNRKTPTRISAGIILHTPNGDYTPEADAILRDMKAI